MQVMQTVADIKTRQSRNLGTDLKFCRSALNRGKVLAAQRQLESATRDVWVVEDTAQAIKSLLSKTQDAEGLDRLVIQLAEVQRGLNDLRKYLDIPPESN